MNFADVEITRVEDYWNARPCNIRHSTAPVGTKEYFDEVETRKYFVEYHIPRFTEFERWRGKKVLEIGCGIGTDTISPGNAEQLFTFVPVGPCDLITAGARRNSEHFGARDVVSGWDVVDAYHRATSLATARFLGVLTERMPFPFAACQVDGGSEFATEFEESCRQKQIPLFVLPKTERPCGAVESHA